MTHDNIMATASHYSEVDHQGYVKFTEDDLINFANAILSRASEQVDEAADAARMRAICEELDRNRRGIRYDGMSIWDAMCDAIGNDLDGKGFRKAMDKAIAARAKEPK